MKKHLDTRLVIVLAVLLAGCEGDARPFEEAVEIRTGNLVALSVVPPSMSVDTMVLNVGQSVQFALDGTSAAGETTALSAADRQWRVSNADVASIDSNGRLVAKANGSVSVMLSIGGLEAEPFDLRVADFELLDIEGIAGADTVERCVPGEFQVRANYADGSIRDIYNNVSWSLSDEDADRAEIVINDSSGVGGLNGVNPGSVTLTASIIGTDLSAEKQVEVSDSLESLLISTGSVDINVGDTKQFEAKGTYSGQSPDGSGEEDALRTLEVTQSVQWRVASGTSYASVSNASIDRGTVTGNAVGTAVLMASCGSLETTDGVTVTVSTSTSSINIDDPTDITANTSTLTLNRSGVYVIRVSAGSVFDDNYLLTNSNLTWANNTSGAVELDTSSSNSVTVTGQATGSGSIKATHNSSGASVTINVEVNN